MNPNCGAHSLADVADRIVTGSSPDEAVWSFVARFCHSPPDDRQAMLDPEPIRTGQPRWDAYLAAAAEHLAKRWLHHVPEWPDAPCRFLAEDWFPAGSSPALRAIYKAESPPPFARRRIWTEREPLLRARVPDLDDALVTALGVLEGTPIRLSAIRGCHARGADPTYATIMLEPVPTPRGIPYSLMTVLSPYRMIFGPSLPMETFAALRDFLERHRDPLLRHWGGWSNSAELLRTIS
jgi:hypothetical protein